MFDTVRRPEVGGPPTDGGDPWHGGGDGSGGDLVRVASAAHQAEAEFLQGILQSEGIPSLVKRSRGSDVPDFLAAGRRDLFVERRRELDARDALLQTEDLDSPELQPVDPVRLLAVLLLALAIVAAIVWLGFR